MIDKLKVHATSGSGAGVTTFWRSLFSGESLPLGGRYFREVLAATKFDVNFGGLLLSGDRYYRKFTVCGLGISAGPGFNSMSPDNKSFLSDKRVALVVNMNSEKILDNIFNSYKITYYTSRAISKGKVEP